MKTRIKNVLGAILVLLTCAFLSMQAGAVGAWTKLDKAAPAGIGTMLLLPNGTVMAQQSGISANWYLLIPDNHGSYIHGNWTNLNSMTYTRLYYSSAVLQNGQVFVAGAEYGTGWNRAEIYNPGTGNWTEIAVPSNLITQNNTVNPTNGINSAGFMDSGCVLLQNGTVLISPVNPGTGGGTVVYNPFTTSFSAGPVLTNNDVNTDEASWVKLPDDSILSFDSSFQSQRFIPSLNKWIPDANLPVQLYDIYGGETGAGFLLPNGKAFFLGSSGNTVIYTPSGNQNPGTWTIGPSIPAGQGTPDAAAAMMVNGKIVCAVSPAPYGYASSNIFTVPTSFYEYDYTVGSVGTFTQTSSPKGGLTDQVTTFNTRFLDLPDGTVLFTDGGSQLYSYQPDTAALAAGQPTINTISYNGNGTVHVTGTLLNGITQGAAYGDDVQMDSNYPLIGLRDGAGNFAYGTSFNWNSTSVYTASRPLSTEFVIPAVFLYVNAGGTYSLTASANGNVSSPLTFAGPIWVDFSFGGFIHVGSFPLPFNTLASGLSAVSPGGAIFFRSAGSSSETPTINQPVTLVATAGAVTIGH